MAFMKPHEHIKSRPKKDMTQKYLDWVELNKDKVKLNYTNGGK